MLARFYRGYPTQRLGTNNLFYMAVYLLCWPMDGSLTKYHPSEKLQAKHITKMNKGDSRTLMTPHRQWRKKFDHYMLSHHPIIQSTPSATRAHRVVFCYVMHKQVLAAVLLRWIHQQRRQRRTARHCAFSFDDSISYFFRFVCARAYGPYGPYYNSHSAESRSTVHHHSGESWQPPNAIKNISYRAWNQSSAN